MPKVSVIIPCYNQGMYIDETIESVLKQTFDDYEIIVVNDGSTDELTNEKLKNYHFPRVRVITTLNQGLAEARNTGIRNSSGEYILPLDADDTIADTYIEKAVAVLDKNPSAGIVYSRASLFGEQTGEWGLDSYSDEIIMRQNVIFCSAFFRRSDYDRTPGYNKNMLYGWEDWDFWLSLLELGVKVVSIPEILFNYRIKNVSMVKQLLTENVKTRYLKDQIVKNHLDFYLKQSLNPIDLIFEKNRLNQVENDLRIEIRRLSQVENDLRIEFHRLSHMSIVRYVYRRLKKRFFKFCRKTEKCK